MRKSGNKIKPWKCSKFPQYLYWENSIYTMKYWINQRWWSAKVIYDKNAVTLYARPWAGFAMGVPNTECSIHHSCSYWQTTGKTQLKPLNMLTGKDHILAKPGGKCCHSVWVLKNTLQGWHSFTRNAALKELSSFHIKIQISWGPACRFYPLSDMQDWVVELTPQTIADKTSYIRALHTLSQAFELSQLLDHWRGFQNYSWSTTLEYNFFLINLKCWEGEGGGGSFFDGLKANRKISLVKICFCIKQENKKYQS